MNILNFLEQSKLEFPLLYRGSNKNLDSIEPFPGNNSTFRKKMMDTDGYFHEVSALNKYQVEIKELVSFIKKLNRENLPPVLAFYADFPWIAFQSLNQIFSEQLEKDFLYLPCFWAWFVDPKKAQAGWLPHRDKGARKGLFANGDPKALTCWIPLTEATPLNGCMYIIPKQHDLNYGIAGADGLNINGLPVIRALPGKPGDIFVWDQTLFHWGAQTSEFASEPRLSMALELQSNRAEHFKSPVLNPNELISERLRLKLIGKQMLQYDHMHLLSDEQEKMANFLCELD
jgi:hypothetical protein